MTRGFACKNGDGRNADRRLANRRLQPLGHLTVGLQVYDPTLQSHRIPTSESSSSRTARHAAQGGLSPPIMRATTEIAGRPRGATMRKGGGHRMSQGAFTRPNRRRRPHSNILAGISDLSRRSRTASRPAKCRSLSTSRGSRRRSQRRPRARPQLRKIACSASSDRQFQGRSVIPGRLSKPPPSASRRPHLCAPPGTINYASLHESE